MISDEDIARQLEDRPVDPRCTCPRLQGMPDISARVVKTRADLPVARDGYCHLRECVAWLAAEETP